MFEILNIFHKAEFQYHHIYDCDLNNCKKSKKKQKQTLKFWKPWIWWIFLLFLVLTRDRNNFETKMSFIQTSELKIHQVQNIRWQLWFEKLKKSKELRYAESFLKCLNFQYEKIYLETTLKTENYYEIEDTWKYDSAVVLKMFLFGTCFFEHGFLALVVCKMFFITAKIIINYSYLLNLNFLQRKCFSTYDWAAPSGASACRPYG